MTATLCDTGYQSCKADPDVWMKAEVKPSSEKYWAYVLCYIDNLLVISHDPRAVMNYLSEKYTLKQGSVKEPDMYLGNEVKKWNISDCDNPEKPCWAMSSDLYIKRAVSEVKNELDKLDQHLSTCTHTPMSAGYRPEVDGTGLLGPNQANYFQGLIGILHWICELGCIDILVNMAMLSQFLVAPQVGHLEQVLHHIFAFLKKHDRSALVFDDTVPKFEDGHFQKCDWQEFYPGACEVMPPDAPKIQGNFVTMSCFVEMPTMQAAGLHDIRTQGVLIFINKAPTMWYSK